METETARELLFAVRARAAYMRRIRTLSSPRGIRRFCRHSVTTVPYYSALRKARSIDDFPVVARSDYSRDPGAFVSSGVPGTPTLIAHSHGTTGHPIPVRFDEAGWYHFNYASLTQACSTIGCTFESKRAGVVLVTNRSDKTHCTAILPDMGATTFERYSVATAAEANATVAALTSRQPTILYGKPTYLLELMDYEKRRDKKCRIRPMALLTSGEPLYADHRELLQRWFGASVFNAYIATESGLLASGCHLSPHLHIRGPSILEVGDYTRIATEGEGQAIVTNPVNWATCLVRYQLGDEISIRRTECKCGFNGRSIVKFQGRDAADLSDDNGRSVAVATLEAAMRDRGVHHYRFVESATGLVCEVALPEHPSMDSYLSSTAATLHAITNADIEVRRVARITPQGGKLRRFVSK